MRLYRGKGHRTQPCRAEDLSAHVEAAAMRISRFRQRARRKSDGCEADRYDDEKNAPPVEALNEHPAERRPDGQRNAVASRPDAERPAALARIAPQDANDGERGGN